MYKDLTVCVNNIKTRKNAVLAAFKTAQRHGGNVRAIYIKLDPVTIMSWQGTAPMIIANHLLVDLDRREQEAKSDFEKLASNYECKTTWLTLSESDNPIKGLLCTDIIFADQPNLGDDYYHHDRDFLNNLILETKRPVIMIPKEWQQESLFPTVLLGWNAGAEAMRATSDAMPFLKSCDRVVVVDVLTDRMLKRVSDAPSQIQEYLSNNDINHQFITDNCSKMSEIPDTFLKRATDEAVDLIVVGGYGHSRLREIIMGGMTDKLIKASSIPVLFSH
jgi:nucleotide-binding universal stress UspA family protein